ncbi:MAG: hypothetical protein K2N41_04120 [Lachnospiraceae bacterium]|nr:hypothetical protein [Lachnospiraceae bacterium]MDE7238880.1 hypothetical protein [Lachnospiraceae bacterium]
MQDTIMQFFEVVGVSSSTPETFVELVTWFVFIFVGMMLVLSVFHVIGTILSYFFSCKR